MSTNDAFLAILIYVDDIIIASNNTSDANTYKRYLDSKFKLKDLCPLRFFLGLKVGQSTNGISVSQRPFTLQLLTNTGYIGAKAISTPMEPNIRLSKDTDPLLADPTFCRSLIGHTWPRSLLLQQLSPQLKAYAKTSLVANDVQLKVFFDVDWGTCPDTRRSVTGYCIFLRQSLISWKSKKQNIISRSSVEVEYHAMANTTWELIWLLDLLKDFGIQHMAPALMFCDYKAAIHLSKNTIFHERTKHVDIDCHIVRERVQRGQLKLLHINTKHNLANLLTKPLFSPNSRSYSPR
uniref:Reverse transcriptase Ty1/copia-type domain-containing protein n=1 Tax=Cannabis sativa TaxID=3483 RepID=A0A803PBF9_CANSA